MVWTMGRSGRLRVLHIPGGILYRRADVARVLTEREGQGVEGGAIHTR